MVDILEIAQYCKSEYEQKCEKSDSKCGYSIHYVAISDDGQIRISKTPHVLAGSEKCYLIHSWQQKAVTCWYETYAVQSFNVYGEVGSGTFDDDYSFSITAAGFNRPEMISLKRNGHELYSVSLWERGCFVLPKRLEYIWELYKKCRRECTTQYESELLCELAAKDDSIKDLENRLADTTLKEQYLRDEIAQYRTLLDEVRSALKS